MVILNNFGTNLDSGINCSITIPNSQFSRDARLRCQKGLLEGIFFAQYSMSEYTRYFLGVGSTAGEDVNKIFMK